MSAKIVPSVPHMVRDCQTGDWLELAILQVQEGGLRRVHVDRGSLAILGIRVPPELDKLQDTLTTMRTSVRRLTARTVGWQVKPSFSPEHKVFCVQHIQWTFTLDHVPNTHFIVQFSREGKL